MAKSTGIDVRKKTKKKKSLPTGVFIARTIVSSICLLVLSIAFIFYLINSDKIEITESLDLIFMTINFDKTTVIVTGSILLFIMTILTYFSALALHEDIRTKKHPSEIEKQIQLIENQFFEGEKKVFISSKDKLKQIEDEEKERIAFLKEKYGDEVEDDDPVKRLKAGKKKMKQRKKEQKAAEKIAKRERRKAEKEAKEEAKNNQQDDKK